MKGRDMPMCFGDNHKWTPAGGCKENPGYYGVGGSAIMYSEVCEHCKTERSRIFGDKSASGNRNRGWRYDAYGEYNYA